MFSKSKFSAKLGLFLSGLVLLLTACGGGGNAIENQSMKPEVIARFKAAPDDTSGDPAKGLAIFGKSPCVSCHAINGNGAAIGPALDQIGTNAAKRVPNVTAAQYIHHILTNPEDANLPNYRSTTMPSFAATLSQQELKDLTAFLLNLK